MQTGIELIAQERKEQIEKHGRTVEHDVRLNNGIYTNAQGKIIEKPQLMEAVKTLLIKEEDIPLESRRALRPVGWEQMVWAKMVKKPYLERLIIAGALIAAEIDRIQNSK